MESFPPYNQRLTEYLAEFVSARKRARIESVLLRRTRQITVILEDVFQPHNASAVLRSCECMGVQDVHIVESRNTFQATSGVSLGAAKWLSLQRWNTPGNGLTDCVSHLHSAGYRILAASPHATTCLSGIAPDTKLGLLFGAEERGLSEAALAAADLTFRIPIEGFTESYNISVSVAMCLYHFTRQLRARNDWQLSGQEVNELRQQWYLRCVREPQLLLKRFAAEQSQA